MACGYVRGYLWVFEASAEEQQQETTAVEEAKCTTAVLLASQDGVLYAYETMKYSHHILDVIVGQLLTSEIILLE